MPPHLRLAGGPIYWNAPERLCRTTWAEAVALARRKLAIIPGFNADLFLHFLMLVKALGADPCADPEMIAPREIMQRAADMLRELTEPMPREIFEWNPIQVAERMTATDDFAWNAFAYTYNNYSRDGFARVPLRFGPLVSLVAGGPDCEVCSAGPAWRFLRTANMYPRHWTMPFLPRMVTHRKRFTFMPADNLRIEPRGTTPPLDELCGRFFNGTRTAQEEAFIRPRYSGYVPLQTKGGAALQEIIRDGRDSKAILEKLDTLYRESHGAMIAKTTH